MSATLYFVIFLGLLVVMWLKRVFGVWKKRGFAYVEGSFPFGSVTGVGSVRTIYEATDVFYKQFKGAAPAVGYYSLFNANLLLIDPGLIKDILVKDFSVFHERPLFINKADDPLSANTLTLDGQEWKDRRVKMTPLFTVNKMRLMFEIVDAIGDKFVSVLGSQLEKSSEQDMRPWSQRFTADNIGSVAFGLECKCLENADSEFIKFGRRIFEFPPTELVKLLFSINFPDAARKLGLRFFPKPVGDFFMSIFLQTLEYRRENDLNRNDFVSMVMKLKDFEPKEMAAESLLMFAAGYETSSTLMQFTLYELALNDEIQQRLREEITTAVEENGGKISYEVLHGLKYLDMVINESLRKYPPLPMHARKSATDYKIADTDLIIPKGTNIDINTYSLQHDDEYFPDPESFNPDRFSEDNVKDINHFTFLPFGGGARQCLGMRFGLMQAKIGIAKLITNFTFSPCEQTTMPMKFAPGSPLLVPQGGVRLNVDRIL